MGSALHLKYFQQRIDQNLQGLPGVYRIADDLLITGQGDTKEEADKDHDANLVRLFQRCRERNIKLNKANVATRVKFFVIFFLFCFLCNYSKYCYPFKLAFLLFSCNMRIFLLGVVLRNRPLLIM